MEALRTMVKSVLVIIFVAAFLEIVAPRNDMKRYVNLIIGLFIIVAVLNPFLAVIRQGLSFEVLDNLPSGTQSDTAALLRKGTEMAAGQRKKVTQQYREKLAKQVMALSGLNRNINITGVSIDIVEDTASPNFGQVKKIVLRTGGNSPKSDYNRGNSETVTGEVQVEEINIDTGLPAKGDTGSPDKLERKDTGRGTGDDTARLKELIANFYGLLPEQVEIKD